MAYNEIPPSDLNSDSPITDTLFTEIRDNWIAIKDGENGAPRIVTRAIVSPSPGSNWAFRTVQTRTAPSWEILTNTGNGSLSGVNYYNWQAWRTGSYRFWVNITRASTTTTAAFRVYRNNVAYSQTYTAAVGNTNYNAIFDLSFNAGDLINIYVLNSAAATYSVLGAMVDKPFAYVG